MYVCTLYMCFKLSVLFFLLHITNLLAVQTKKKGTKLLKPRTKASGPAKAKAERKPVASEKTIKEV